MHKATWKFTVNETSNVRGTHGAQQKQTKMDELRNDVLCNIYGLQLVTGMNGARRKMELENANKFFVKSEKEDDTLEKREVIG